MKWKIGCSGFSYSDWNGLFYPEDLPSTKWFEYYASHFDTLELNVTFYKFPTLSFFRNLYDRSPDNFCFVVKAPKLITHTHRFHNSKKLLDDFYAIIKKGLKEKLAMVLFQLPPSFHCVDEHLTLITESMNTNFLNAVEFRHKTWWDEKIYKLLGSKQIIFCGISYPGLPDDVIINTTTPYYRFHGVPKLYYSMYGKPFLNNIADAFLQNKKVRKGFFLFNNTATRAALENASYLQDYFDV
ncbi:MAG: DUF72 domain-containing protein [Ferruginibacter sp.]